MNREASSTLRIEQDGVVHAVKYINDVSLTRCGRHTFSLLVGLGSYCTYTKPDVTCLSCIAEEP